ncbi:hypothetical protein A2U01_0039509, partial [Trifolium medium]|nr:hypothetical protein [Trifolium medium]
VKASPDEPWRDSARVLSLGEPSTLPQEQGLSLSEHSSLAKRSNQFSYTLLRVST